MRRCMTSVMVLCVCAMSMATLRAAEPVTLDQARAHLQQMQEQVKQLQSQGKEDEAREVAKQAEALAQKLEHVKQGGKEKERAEKK